MTNPIATWLRRRNEDAESRVLAAIRDGFDYGFGICRATGLGAGRVYAALWRLEQRGAITSGWEPDPGDRPPRRLYSVRARQP